MLQADILENGNLRVIETTHSWFETKTSFAYYDLDRRLRTTLGKEDEVPSQQMTDGDFQWATSNYLPLAQKQKAQRDERAANLAAQALLDPFSVDPDRFEKARRWSTLVTASLVKDGSYDSMTREKIVVERGVRYDALKLTLRMPSNAEMKVAQMVILDHSEQDRDIPPPQRQRQG